MAVYGGTRPAILVPDSRRAHAPAGRRAAAPADRRAIRRAARARRGVRPVGVALAIVVSIFLLGLVHLTYTLQAGAIRSDIDSLMAEGDRLRREIQSQEGTVARWGSEPQVMDWAQQHGLDRLGGTIRVPSR
jgi:hypothetical protein